MASYQYVYVMKQMSKVYPGNREVLKDVTLAFFPGAKIGVLGYNGAGKSTLLRIMAGTDTEFSGEAWLRKGHALVFWRRSLNWIQLKRLKRMFWKG